MSWPVQDAKARFSEFLETCLTDGPQIVTKRGTETAVLVPIEEWRRLQRDTKPKLIDLLLADEPRGNLDSPDRRRFRQRPPPDLD